MTLSTDDNEADPERLSVTLSTVDSELVGDMLGMRGCAIHLAIQDSPVYGPLKQVQPPPPQYKAEPHYELSRTLPI